MPSAPTCQHPLSCEGRGQLASRCKPSAQHGVHGHRVTAEMR